MIQHIATDEMKVSDLLSSDDSVQEVTFFLDTI